MEKQVVNVDNQVTEPMDDGFHQHLEAIGGPYQVHGVGDPLIFSLSGDCESNVWPGLRMVSIARI